MSGFRHRLYTHPPVRRSIQKTGGHRADARRLRWEEPPSGTEPAGTTANLWSFSDGMVRQLFRKNGVLRVDSKLMPDVKFELHETVQGAARGLFVRNVIRETTGEELEVIGASDSAAATGIAHQ